VVNSGERWRENNNYLSFFKKRIINMIIFVEKRGAFIAPYPMQGCIG